MFNNSTGPNYSDSKQNSNCSFCLAGLCCGVKKICNPLLDVVKR